MGKAKSKIPVGRAAARPKPRLCFFFSNTIFTSFCFQLVSVESFLRGGSGSNHNGNANSPSAAHHALRREKDMYRVPSNRPLVDDQWTNGVEVGRSRATRAGL